MKKLLYLLLLFSNICLGQVVINAVYGAGGNAGSTFKNDFIILFNRGNTTQNLNGWSVQYASSTGTSWSKVNLSNFNLQPGQYYLIQAPSGSGAGTVDLPTPDLITAAISMSATAGKLVLLNTTTLITSGTSNPIGTQIIDKVSYNTTSNNMEGTPTIALSTTTFAYRVDNGCTDNNENSTDFNVITLSTSSQIPNSSSTFNICSCSNSNNVSKWDGTQWLGSDYTYTNKSVIIDGSYNTSSGNIDACSVTVNSGKTLTIGSNQYVNIQNGLTNNGTVDINNNGSLVQVNNTTNTTNINYNRTVSSLRGFDYIYWSSPVANQVLSSLYSTPTMGPKYEWGTVTPNPNLTQGYWVSPTTTNMTNGKGYIIRASSSYGWTGTLTGVFTGVPNNGNITIPIQRGSSSGLNDNWNLIGNPYPSAISINKFLDSTINGGLNSDINGYVYLWKHLNAPTSTTSPFYQSFQYNYLNDYIAINKTGSSSDSTTVNYITSGQGFFVSMQDALPIDTSSIITFNNSMRDTNVNNNTFLKTSENKNGRIWLDLLDVNNNANRILVGYTNEATNGKDRMYDAITSTGTITKIYSLIDNDPYIIQGRAKFKNNDQVKLGINITTAGEHKIAIAEVDGLFETQDIYLEDKLLNITHDLKSNPYIFTSNVGIFNNRFILKYKTNNGHHNSKIENGLIIYNENGFTKINSSQKIKEVKVYNTLGQLIYCGNFNSNDISIESISDQILIFKIETIDGNQITKKVINARY